MRLLLPFQSQNVAFWHSLKPLPLFHLWMSLFVAISVTEWNLLLLFQWQWLQRCEQHLYYCFSHWINPFVTVLVMVTAHKWMILSLFCHGMKHFVAVSVSELTVVLLFRWQWLHRSEQHFPLFGHRINPFVSVSVTMSTQKRTVLSLWMKPLMIVSVTGLTLLLLFQWQHLHRSEQHCHWFITELTLLLLFQQQCPHSSQQHCHCFSHWINPFVAVSVTMTTQKWMASSETWPLLWGL